MSTGFLLTIHIGAPSMSVPMILAFRPFSRAIATNAGSATPAIADFEDTDAKVLSSPPVLTKVTSNPRFS